jgi:Ca2+-binding EF-hand superfamily protein
LVSIGFFLGRVYAEHSSMLLFSWPNYLILCIIFWVEQALLKNATEAMKESRVTEILSTMDSLSFKKMDFPEFCAAATSVHQLEGTDRWERHARAAYDIFEKEGNRVISVEELTREVGLASTVPGQVFHEWVRQTDGRLSYIGFTKLLHGVTVRAAATRSHR